MPGQAPGTGSDKVRMRAMQLERETRKVSPAHPAKGGHGAHGGAPAFGPAAPSSSDDKKGHGKHVGKTGAHARTGKGKHMRSAEDPSPGGCCVIS